MKKEIKIEDTSNVVDTDYTCQASGFGLAKCFGKKTDAHIFTRACPDLRYESMNIIPLCEGHRVWFNTRPISVWYKWVKAHFSQHFKFVLTRIEHLDNEWIEFMKVAKPHKE